MDVGFRWLRVACAGVVLLLGACGGNETALTSTPAEQETQTDTVTAQTVPESETMTLSGKVTYDRVLFGSQSWSGLDYDKTLVLPARGITVQVLDDQAAVIAQTRTDNLGQFTFNVLKNTNVQLRVVAFLQSDASDAAAWDIRVRDNTAGNAQYVLEGTLLSTGVEHQTRNLHAPSGWGGESYDGTRAAAPFAILDSVFDALEKVISARANTVFPPLDIYWSENNIASSGRLEDGKIGTSYYTSYGPSIYLLGAENNDADEYDRAVIQHEFGHYLELQLARSESIGGAHSQLSKLDMRVAFGEAWGNAFAAIAGEDPLYRDSLGAQQSLGFTIDLEQGPSSNQGWFSEFSAQSILYDIFDGGPDDDDALHLGFDAIYSALTSDRYLAFAGFSSIYSFIEELKLQNPDHAAAIALLAERENIFGRGWWGEGETNSAGSRITLPVYSLVEPGGSVNVCSDVDYQDYNGVDVRRFIRLSVSHPGIFQIRATRSHGGLSQANPQLRLYRQGQLISNGLNNIVDVETLSSELGVGEYVVELYEALNADQIESNGGLVCFDVSVQSY